MSTSLDDSSAYQTATAELSISGRRVRVEMSVPLGPTRPIHLLPLFQSLTDTLVADAVGAAEAEGLAVSCKKGCGACCRQLVPISEIEARRLREVVAELPEPRRSEILARFAAALRRLQDAGLLETLQKPEDVTDDSVRALGLGYFAQGIPCPFLEDESCSIYADRPLACREFLVTSPAENCAQPTAETVKCVRMAAKVSKAISRMNAEPGRPAFRWVPLILALDWAAAHPDQSSDRAGTELVRELFQHLTGQDLPASGATML